MLGSILKELFVAFGRFFKYRVSGGRIDAAKGAQPEVAQPQPIRLPDPGLDPALIKLVQWPSHRLNAHPEELLSDPLYQLWRSKAPGGHKWTHYFPAYREVFEPIRSRPLRVLEIGIFNGAGLRLWKSYFDHPETVIVGIDIEKSCEQYESKHESIHVRIGSQADADFLRRVNEEFGPFDVIIDDGSHHSSHILFSFNHLYLDALQDSGVYLVEDLHANYWPGWRDSQRSFLDICKELIEQMHVHYRKAGPREFFIDQPADQIWPYLEVPLIATLIREIRIFDSIAVIYKTKRKFIPYYVQS